MRSDTKTAKLNEQVARLVRSERALYDTQGKLDLSLTRINLLNELSLSISGKPKLDDILKAGIKFIVSNFVVQYAISFVLYLKQSRLVATEKLFRGKEIENIFLSIDSTFITQANISLETNIIIIDDNQSEFENRIITFFQESFAKIFGTRIDLQKNARILLIGNQTQNEEVKTYLLFYCLPPNLIGHREHTINNDDLPFLNLFCKHLDRAIENTIYQQQLQEFAKQLEIKVEERTNELRLRLKLEEMIAEIAKNLSQLQFYEVRLGLQNVLQIIGEFIGNDRVYLCFFSDDLLTMANIIEWDNVNMNSLWKKYQNFPLSEIPKFYETLRSVDVINIPDVDVLPQAWEKEKIIWQNEGMKSILAMSILSQGKPLGFIGLDSSRSKRQWKESEIIMLKTLSELISTVLEREKAGQQLEKAAKYDLLTNLANRYQFEIIADRDLAFAKRHHTMVALLSIDLDNFKNINDIYGHDIGDQLIKEVGMRIKNCVREEDFVARMGGDEFAVIATGLINPAEAGVIAKKILDAVTPEYKIQSKLIFITCSIGIACYPLNGEDRLTLLKNADIAMYHAKNLGKNNFQFLTSSIQTKRERQLEIENNLYTALTNNELYLVYQPQFDSEGKIIGVEALLRWEHPALQLVPTLEFIVIAENSGLIISIEEWVLRNVFMQRKKWQEEGIIQKQKIAINISFREFERFNLCDYIGKIAEECGVFPHDFEIELTETTLMRNPEHSKGELDCLHAKGFSVAIDDFGTGYSSLYYLKSLPIQRIKIDQNFVKGVGLKKEDEFIIDATLSLAEKLNLEVIAEGVETKEQLDFLVQRGCKQFQGYYFSYPLRVDEMTALFRSKINIK